MPWYVTFGQFTEQGIRTLKDIPQRVAAARAAGADAGVQIHLVLYTMGRYDVIDVWEAPNDETATRMTLQSWQVGNLREQTVRAFPPEEFGSLVS